MYKFSRDSVFKLETCHMDIRDTMNEAIQYIDFTVVCGIRGEVEQNKLYLNGYSKLEFPYSKHNKKPSMGIDIVPYPTRYESEPHFYQLCGVIQTIARQKQIDIRWGGDWDCDNEFDDQYFNDLAHWELI